MSVDNRKAMLRMTVNGKQVEIEVKPEWTLLRVLREVLGLTGTKRGCEVGDCGTCTVLMDGQTVNSCLVLALQAQGKRVETVESLGTPENLHPLQESFLDHASVQCGYCTPGMLMSAEGLLRKNPAPSRAEIKRGLSGNLCRCTGYVKIIEAVEEAAPKRAARKEG